MWLGASLIDELVANLGRKRQIGELIAVDVTQLDFPQPELDATETVAMHGYPVPAGNGVLDRVACTIHAWMNGKAPVGIPRREI